jgi:hypothetical protein
MEHDPFRKPVLTPHQVRGRLFRDYALKRNDQNKSARTSGVTFVLVVQTAEP